MGVVSGVGTGMWLLSEKSPGLKLVICDRKWTKHQCQGVDIAPGALHCTGLFLNLSPPLGSLERGLFSGSREPKGVWGGMSLHIPVDGLSSSASSTGNVMNSHNAFGSEGPSQNISFQAQGSLCGLQNQMGSVTISPGSILLLHPPEHSQPVPLPNALIDLSTALSERWSTALQSCFYFSPPG